VERIPPSNRYQKPIDYATAPAFMRVDQTGGNQAAGGRDLVTRPTNPSVGMENIFLTYLGQIFENRNGRNTTYVRSISDERKT
jgi:hypothetical protein